MFGLTLLHIWFILGVFSVNVLVYCWFVFGICLNQFELGWLGFNSFFGGLIWD